MTITKGAPDAKPRDIHAYLAEFDDIPGTRVYTAARARKGYHINQFAMSLMKAENRARFKADERAYLDEWQISEEGKQALLARDYNTLLDMGGNVYFLSKLFSSDGLPFAEAVSTMTDMTWPEYRQMMLEGGRSPEGNRSIKENLAAAARAQETGKDN
ncbi:protocatechuate 4,5-dioxygenase subunit alpha [Novosphingobium sp. BK486]|uniref:protocatechuate 4,5-dioxygenase subunit alpha n=1 Tax=unclassified Novosphingobium TaxID=2644732 RepID=UPI0018002190|nr:protocatechuate 4,5-dioxygenase alpha chain [Novosphingobium sp. BK256]MBB3375874.1 protocatechuate 4,5-dioxygenase alpha chain [Novosphingobium sp. BK280]MBB3380287.1 protocatechuate 4,5-dioxygenase alpha chain [Novosphingobium sp. BK258]MBB3421982.1 protocatechuate 4,5-dioxygenase alpha chain [Novosphingobium sp. BK267]MBB3450638.1 protocatechuate 4,5-dioxygenase alpha chain [Novosphingobium sp. BK352]MBB3479148.1 protocatechuate 4,5-dioxygenase alpha chain [Novosphingobium sp. BK369]MBB